MTKVSTFRLSIERTLQSVLKARAELEVADFAETGLSSKSIELEFLKLLK